MKKFLVLIFAVLIAFFSGVFLLNVYAGIIIFSFFINVLASWGITMAQKEVYFDMYCQLCKYERLEADKDPCNDCLGYPSNEDSHVPIRWDPKDEYKDYFKNKRKEEKK